MTNDEPPERIEAYMRAVKNHLRSLPPAEVAEIARELLSHIQDRIAGDLSDAHVSATLKKLGDPRDIARANMQMRAAMVHRRYPSTRLGAIVRWAALSGRGFVTLLLSLAGYGFAGCWLLTAIAKPFAPSRVGLWVLPDSTGDLALSLGRHEAGYAGNELLGWWIIPIGLAIGICCCICTYRFNLRVIRKMESLRSTVRQPTG